MFLISKYDKIKSRIKLVFVRKKGKDAKLKVEIELIGAPFFLGSKAKGTEQAPEIIRKLNLQELFLDNKIEYYDYGDINVLFNNSDFLNKLQINNFDGIVKSSKQIKDEVYNRLDKKRLPLILGGDHSISIGSLAASSSFFDNLGVVWLDAHPDINTPHTSPSQNAHGMPLSFALGYGPKEIVSLYQNYLNPNNIHIIGLRSIDEGEREIIKKHHINYYDKSLIEKKGIDFIASEIVNLLRKNMVTNIHFSFDIDVLDPSLVPGTGTPVPEGLFIEEITTLINILFESKMIRLIDLVEYNPLLDNATKTTQKTVMQLLDIMISNLAKV